MIKIGVRIPGQARNLPFEEFCNWCHHAGFQALDVPAATPEVVSTAAMAGLEIGTADLPGTRDLCSSDPERQAAGVDAAREAIRTAAENGVNKMFCVFVPEDAARGRAANFESWAKSFPAVAEHAASLNVRIAMEGWPGPAPHYPALGCTPEMWRRMFSECPSPAFGLNFDPSHLVRIGIDWMRALDEFAGRVIHVHGKDTDIDTERLYEHGNVGPTFQRPRAFGESWWRYTIPGDGLVNWGRLLGRLEDAGFDGIISVELEDHRYHGTWEREAEGLRRSQRHLAHFMRG
jgi:sugar phosphate isomerase/epimerase